MVKQETAKQETVEQDLNEMRGETKELSYDETFSLVYDQHGDHDDDASLN